VRDGSIGLGDSFVDGDWSSPDLAGCLRFFLDNWNAVADYKLNILKPMRWLNRVAHSFNKNSLSKSKENISAHYDLSNEMFRMFLDPSMTYSSAIYRSPSDTLEQAQYNKVDRILDLARLEPSDHVLEIGSGWGTLALRAHERFNCKVTSLSLSQEQLSVARERAYKSNAHQSIDFLEQDYRQVQGEFDKIVSVEMLEAVGHEYLASFFATCERVLKPEGVVVLQVIAFPDFEYKRYLKRQDWIQKRIFPGSHLPSLTSLMQAIETNSNLIVESIDNIGPHYARTLKEWNEQFTERWSDIKPMGFDDRFKKLWQFYLASCEAEFATRWLAVYQIVLSRPNNHFLINRDKHEIYETPKLEVVSGIGCRSDARTAVGAE
jgi:cyclopropane-fatty-acyl-phospholipid synthase